MRRAVDRLDVSAEVTTRLFDNLNAGTRTMRALLGTESMRHIAATLDAANKALPGTESMRHIAATLDAANKALPGTESMRHIAATLDAANKALPGTESMRHIAATLDAANKALPGTESMRHIAATLDAANKAWAALDYSKLAELWSTPDTNMTFRDVAASSLRRLDDLKKAPRDLNEATGLPAPQPDGAAAHPACLLVLLALSVTHVEEASEVVLAVLRELLFALRLLSVVEDLDPAIPGLSLLVAVVGVVLTLFQSADRE